MKIIRAKRSIAYLNNQRSFSRYTFSENKGLTSENNDAILKEQLEFNFNK